MQIYMIRHGETDRNVKGHYYGVTEAVLTEAGRHQAECLGEFFREFDWKKVYVSPLKRAVDTAELVLGSKCADYSLDDRLQEQNFGIFEDYTYQNLCDLFPEEFDSWNADFSNYRIPDGESFRDVRDRVEAWVEERKAEVKEGLWNRQDKVLIVAHKGTLGHMMAAFLGLPLESYWNFVFEQGCYNRIDLEDGYAIIRKLNQSI